MDAAILIHDALILAFIDKKVEEFRKIGNDSCRDQICTLVALRVNIQDGLHRRLLAQA